MLENSEVKKFGERWSSILATEHMIRSEIAARSNWRSGNVDKMLGFESHQIPSLFLENATRHSPAARNFSRAIQRYWDLIKQADKLRTAGNPQPAIVYKMYGAALVFALASFDAYIRQLTIDGYLYLFFNGGSPRGDVDARWTNAISAAVKSNPMLMVQIAQLRPNLAKELLAREVFQTHQVRIMTGDFNQCCANLKTIGLSIEIKDNYVPSNDTEQLLKLSPPIFDVFAQTRHRIIHVGMPPNSHYYCENQEPVWFVGYFLKSLVTIIERRWDVIQRS